MPDLNGAPRKMAKIPKPNADESKPKKKKTPTARDVSKVKKPSHALYDADNDPLNDEDEDDDEEIEAAVSKKGDNKIVFVVAAVIVVCFVIVGFIIFGGKGEPNNAVDDPGSMPASSQSQSQNDSQQIPQQSQTSDPQGDQSTEVPAPNEDPNVGIQDFTQNTTMTTSGTPTSGDEFIKDLYGLSTRVDYTVDNIYEATDFVNYEKKRGTWDGGLELYYLDATYKGRQYVVQIPFKYYKELDDIGTVPVKMEVLRIKGSSSEDDRTIISYMTLDEKVLETVMKSATKSK